MYLVLCTALLYLLTCSSGVAQRINLHPTTLTFLSMMPRRRGRGKFIDYIHDGLFRVPFCGGDMCQGKHLHILTYKAAAFPRGVKLGGLMA